MSLFWKKCCIALFLLIIMMYAFKEEPIENNTYQKRERIWQQ